MRDTIVYFTENAFRIRFEGLPASAGIIQCERCACLVFDQEASREQHISFHRGWWVGYHEDQK